MLARPRRLVGYVISALLVMMAAPVLPADAAQFPTVTAFPASLSLAPGEQGAGSLLIRNDSASPVTLTGVKAAPSSSTVQVHINRRPPHCLAAGAAVSLGFTVMRVSAGFEHDVGVQFTLNYRAGHTGSAASGEQTVIASPALQLITASIDGNVSAVSQYRPADLAIVVTNPDTDPVTLTKMTVTGVHSVSMSVDTGSDGVVPVAANTNPNVLSAGPIVLGPREIRAFPVELSTGDQVDPGARMLLVHVTAASGAGSGPPASSADDYDAVATHPFSVEVYGESDILNGLGAPGFLLLPGIVFAIAVVFLVGRLSYWRSVVPPPQGVPGVIGAATVTGIGAVLASLVIALIYPWVTETFVPGVQRNYLEAYGFVDFYYILAYSLLFAGIFWALSVPAYRLAQGMLWLKIDGDDVHEVFKRLAFPLAFRSNRARPLVTLSGPGGQKAVVLKHGSSKVWTSPVIRIEVVNNAGNLAARLDEMIRNNRLSAIYRTVRKAERQDHVRVSFAPGMASGPKTVNEGDAPPNGQSRRAVERAPSI